MKYTLYHANDALVMNSFFYGEKSVIYNKRSALAAFNLGDYEEVRVFELDENTSDLAVCNWIYAKSQNIHEPWKLNTRSTSVGDIIRFETGELYIVAAYGFDRLQ